MSDRRTPTVQSELKVSATKSGWKCETCKNAGTIRHEADADVYTVFNLLVAAHATESDGLCVRSEHLRAWPIPAASLPEESKNGT